MPKITSNTTEFVKSYISPEKFLLILLTVLSLILSYSFYSSGITDIIRKMPDDAFYYLKIASNAAAGYGFTFDRINTTNGFQPLWLLSLIPFSCLIHSGELFLKSALVFQIILLALSSGFVYSFQKKTGGKALGLTTLFCFLPFVFFKSINGMETALVVFILSIWLFVINKISHRSSKSYLFFLGILSGLVILSRLDSAVFVLSYIVMFFSKEKSFRSVLIIAGGIIMVITPYFILNYSAFDNFFPVSGFLKSNQPGAGINKGLFLFTPNIISVFIPVFLAAGLILWLLTKKNKKILDSQYFILSVLSTGLVLHLLFLLFFTKGGIYYHHFIYYKYFIAVLSGFILNRLIDYFKITNKRILLAFFILSVVFFFGYKIFKLYSQDERDNLQTTSYFSAIYVKEHTDKSDVFAMSDAGVFGFFCERNVINLDGLVNNFEYQEVIKKKELNNYLRKNKVKYIVQHQFCGNDSVNSGNYTLSEIRYFSSKYGCESDPVLLRREKEILRSAFYNDGNCNTSLVIWKIND